ncbi:MAG: hypothetical protein O3A25_01100 [Acidobacteria bacterium]|nr:hypothetical protein [Acidobacteriota bacterium]
MTHQPINAEAGGIEASQTGDWQIRDQEYRDVTMTKRRMAGVAGWLVAVCLVATSAGAQQRPLLTEDPESIGDGLLLLEAGFDHSWDHPFPVSGLTGSLLRGPLVGLSFGLGPFAEVQIDGISTSRLLINERAVAPLSSLVDVPGDSTRSFDDIVIGTKVKIVSEVGWRPAMALRFATRLPNASNESGLGLDTFDFYQSLLVGKTVQSIRVVGNVGFAILADPTRGDRQNDVLTYGFSLARAFAPGAEVVGEINGRASTRRGQAPPGTDTKGQMTFGVRYTRNAIRFDAGLFTGLTSRDPKVGITGGITWVFSSPLRP